MGNLSCRINTDTNLATSITYGKLVRMVCEELGYKPPPTHQGDPTWTCGLAWGEPKETEDAWVWTMYDNLAEAIKELGIAK